LSDLVKWTKGKFLGKSQHSVRNGLICLKGGDIDAEISAAPKAIKDPLRSFFDEPFFKDKVLVHVPQ
jgi:16S rRNA (guanine527-N7)-methyltransferase